VLSLASLLNCSVVWSHICDHTTEQFNNEAKLSTDCKLPDVGLVKPKHVGAFIVYFNVNFNILKQIGCALVGLIKDWITSECTVQL